MVKFPSITLSHEGSYIVLASSMFNVGLPGTYIVYAKGNPKTLYKMLKSEGVLEHTIYYQLENFEILKNHSELVKQHKSLKLYKYKKGNK